MSETLCRTYTKTSSVVYVKFKCNWASLIVSDNSTAGRAAGPGYGHSRAEGHRAVKCRRKRHLASPSRAPAERSSSLTWSPAAASKGSKLALHLRPAAQPRSPAQHPPARLPFPQRSRRWGPDASLAPTSAAPAASRAP